MTRPPQILDDIQDGPSVLDAGVVSLPRNLTDSVGGVRSCRDSYPEEQVCVVRYMYFDFALRIE